MGLALITGIEVTGAVKQLRSGSAPRVDEICLDLLKALDVVGLSWLTCLCNVAWTSGTVLFEWQTGVVGFISSQGLSPPRLPFFLWFCS